MLSFIKIYLTGDKLLSSSFNDASLTNTMFAIEPLLNKRCFI